LAYSEKFTFRQSGVEEFFFLEEKEANCLLNLKKKGVGGGLKLRTLYNDIIHYEGGVKCEFGTLQSFIPSYIPSQLD
jgi:hypothetical protein